MTLQINTNANALLFSRHLSESDNKIKSSVERIGTGLRINKAADDASGMLIADSLRSNIIGSGQAIRNANDAISLVQIADGAIDESIKIVTTIKTKSIQAAQDGQTAESRKIIQSDINKLIDEMDIIATTTSFNGKKLLSGDFANKSFQVGANTGETMNISIDSAESNKVGHITTNNLYISKEGKIDFQFKSKLNNEIYNLAPIEFLYNNSKENGMGALADSLNKLPDTGIKAIAVVSVTTQSAVSSGILEDIFVNGVNIGSLSVQENDQDGSLVKAINSKTTETGVTASINDGGKLNLASDGRAIEVTGNTFSVLKNTSDIKSFGYLQLIGSGATDIQIKQTNADVSPWQNFTFDKWLDISKSIDTAMTYNGVSPSSTRGEAEAAIEYAVSIWEDVLDLDVPFQIAVNFTDLGAGGALANGGPTNVLENFNGAPLTDVWYVPSLANNLSGSDLQPGAEINININTNAAFDWYLGTDGQTGAGQFDLVTVMMHEIAHGLGFLSGADATGSLYGGKPFVFDLFLEDGSGNNFVDDMNNAQRAAASIGGDLWWSTSGAPMYAPNPYDVGSSVSHFNESSYTGITGLMTPMLGPAESIHTITDPTLSAFEDLGYKILTSPEKIGSFLLGQADDFRMSDISVLTSEDAQIAIAISDETLKDFDKIRSNIGSTQNQLVAVIQNLSMTNVNLSAAESSIRDVDFADEMSILQKQQILSQSGSFAIQQANSSADAVLSLLK